MEGEERNVGKQEKKWNNKPRGRSNDKCLWREAPAQPVLSFLGRRLFGTAVFDECKQYLPFLGKKSIRGTVTPSLAYHCLQRNSLPRFLLTDSYSLSATYLGKLTDHSTVYFVQSTSYVNYK